MTASRTVSDEALIDFVYHEARLLDEKRYDEWRALYTEDGFYWMPLEHDQPDPDNHTSLLYDDQLLMEVRIARMAKPRAFSLHPEVHAHHLLAQPRVQSRDIESRMYVLRTDFQYTETKGDKLLQLMGTAYHHLIDDNGTLRLKQKRVNLVNSEASHPAVQLYP